MIVSGEIVVGSVVGGQFVEPEVVGTIVLLDTSFPGAGLPPGFTSLELDGTDTIAISDGLDYTVNAGGSGDAFWFDAERGTHLGVLVDGDFDCVLTGRVRNLSDDGLPTVGDGNFRIAGIMALDLDNTEVNSEHVGWGCTASAAITAEWKDTEDSVSDFGDSPAATGAGQLRLTRVGQDFAMYERASENAAWTELHTHTRVVPMPDVLRVGVMCYASVAGHDIRLQVSRLRITRPL